MSPPSDLRRPRTRSLALAGIVAAALLIGIVILGLGQRARSSAELREWTEANAVPTVSIVMPQPLEEAGGLKLPGRIEAYAQAPIYARVSGYVRAWHVDIGAQVAAGQLLVELETPDLDHQLAQARADLAKAEVDAELAQTTARRWQVMFRKGAVARQAVDEKTGDAAAKEAVMRAARANLDRLVATQGFKRITAPFAGIVTSRSVDVGALIDAGAGSRPELFTVADIDRLRVYVQVPQPFVPAIRIGTDTQITVPEYPGRSFVARVETMARAVDARSGATLVQLTMDNPDGLLLPGGYAEVEIALPSSSEGLSLPASALIFTGAGMQVAVLGPDETVVMKAVEITRDLGKTVDVTGLMPEDRVIDNPPDSLAAGDQVVVAHNPVRTPAETRAAQAGH